MTNSCAISDPDKGVIFTMIVTVQKCLRCDAD